MKFILTVIIVFLLILWLIRNKLSQRLIIKTFKRGNVMVVGMKGKGKDLLFNYVINKRKKPYISNVDYTNGENHIDFNPAEQFNVGGNTCQDLIEGSIKHYEYPYDDGIDYYISDGGVYFPSQEDSLLKRKYRGTAIFAALSRHLGDCNVHVNVQNYNRLWLLLREQSDNYILCKSARVFFGRIARQKLYIYDKAQSCQDRVKPMKRRFGKSAHVEYDKFVANYGSIKKIVFWHFIKNKYDSRVFKHILEAAPEV